VQGGRKCIHRSRAYSSSGDTWHRSRILRHLSLRELEEEIGFERRLLQVIPEVLDFIRFLLEIPKLTVDCPGVNGDLESAVNERVEENRVRLVAVFYENMVSQAFRLTTKDRREVYAGHGSGQRLSGHGKKCFRQINETNETLGARARISVSGVLQISATLMTSS